MGCVSQRVDHMEVWKIPNGWSIMEAWKQIEERQEFLIYICPHAEERRPYVQEKEGPWEEAKEISGEKGKGGKDAPIEKRRIGLEVFGKTPTTHMHRRRKGTYEKIRRPWGSWVVKN